MAITLFSGGEMGTLGEFVSAAGTISASTNQKNTGAYSIRCNPTAGISYLNTNQFQKRLSFYLYIATTPDGDTGIVDGTNFWGLYLTTNREIDLYEGAVKRVDGTTVLDTGKWYRISMTVDSTDGHCYYWIDGNAEGDFDGTQTQLDEYIGAYISCTTDLYFDDIVFDDTAASTADLGDIRVQLAQPNANGDVNNFDGDTDGGADHYTFYDDNAGSLDDNDYVIHEAKTVVQDIANLESSSQAGLGGIDTINAVRICYRWKLSKDGDDLPSVYVKDDGTGYATVVPRDSDGVWYWDFKLYATNAPRGTAWTQGIFDAFQAGMQSSGDAADLYMSCVMVMVAYTPVAYQELTAAAVGETSSVVQASIAGTGTAPLTGTVSSVTSSIQGAVVAGSGNAPLTGTVASVTSSVVTAAIENVSAEQELTAAVIAVTSSVSLATIAGSGNAPLTGAVVSVTSSVSLANIAGSGDAPLTAAIVGVTSSIQNAAIAGSGIAPLTGTIIAVTGSVSQASVGFILQSSSVAVTSSVATATIAGSGAAPLMASIIGVTSSIVNSALAATGAAPLTGTVISVTSSISLASIAGSGTAPLTASTISTTASVVGAILVGSGNAPLTATTIAVTSSIQGAVIGGVGAANLTASPITVTSSVANGEVVASWVIRALPIAVISSVAASSISGTGVAPLTASSMAVATSVQSASVLVIRFAVVDLALYAQSIVASLYTREHDMALYARDITIAFSKDTSITTKLKSRAAIPAMRIK